MSGPVQQYEELLSSSDFVFVVFYRGHWCPFCISYLRKLQELTPAIEARGGRVLAVTAEPESELEATRKASGFQGAVVVDAEHALATELKTRGLVSVAITERKGYAAGMAQPAVLVQQKEKTLFSWAIVPSMMNVGGATDRPVLDQVWHNVEAQLDGKPEMHKKIKSTSFTGLIREKMFG